MAVALAGAGCGPRPATEMVLRFGSDIDASRVRRVELDLAWTDQSSPFALRTYSFVELLAGGGTRRFPGSITVVPTDAARAAETGRVLRIDARVIVADGAGGERVYVRSRSLARFARERTVSLDIYFSDLCGSSGVSDRCLETETCQLVQSEARCVAVETQAELPNYSPSAPPPMPPGGSTLDASATLDATLDVAAPDVPSLDVALDASVAPLPAWWPWHGARMSSGNVAFRWNPSAYTGAQTLQVCSDRACSAVVASMASAAGSARLTLAPGAYFWRVFEQGAVMQRPARVITIARSGAAEAQVLGTLLHWTDTNDPQWVAGAPGTTQGAIVLALPLPARPPWLMYTGPANLPLFGSTLANVGDLDDDGFSEVGAGQRSDVVPAVATTMQVFYGAVSDPFMRSASLNFPGFSRAGYALATAGDLDGDGRADMLVGAPAELSGSGRVRIYNGAAGQTLVEQASDDGVAGSSGYGTVLTGGCDFDGDGFGDYVVSAVSRARNAVAGGDPPSVYVVFGGAARATQRVRVMPPAGFTAVRFGAALACGGDLDGDGLSELAVGDPRAQIAGMYAGAVVVYRFARRAPSVRQTLLSSMMADGQEFGASVSFVANAGARDDLLVGVPGASAAKMYFGGSLALSAANLIGTGVASYGRVVASPGIRRADSPGATIVTAAPEAPTAAVTASIWTTPVIDFGMVVSGPTFAPTGLPAGARLGAAIAY